MTQSMGTYRGVETRHFQVLVHFPANASCAEPFAMLVDKQNPGVEVAIALCSPIAEFHIMLNSLNGGRADRSQSFFFAFAADMQHFAQKVNVLDIQPDNLAHPYACAVKGLHNRPVPCSEPVIRRRSFQQSLDLVIFEKFWQFFILLWRANGHYRISGKIAALYKEFVEAPQ